MSRRERCVFATEFKQGVVLRLEGGERLAAVADELKISASFSMNGGPPIGQWGLPASIGNAVRSRDIWPPARFDAAKAPDAWSELARAKARIRRAGAQGRQAADRISIFSRSLAAHRRVGGQNLGGQDQRDVLYAVIETMSAPRRKAAPRSTICARWRKRPRRLLSLRRGSQPRAGGSGLARQNPDHRAEEPLLWLSRNGPGTWRLHGLRINHKRLRRLMGEDNLLCLRSKPFVPYTTNSRHEFPIVPNLTRGLVATGLDQIWAADITYVRLAGQFVYLAVVLDAFSRKVVGWALADHLEASLGIEALDMALAARNPAPGLIHHSDRGVQVCVRRLRRSIGGAGLTRQHEPRRQSLRQCKSRTLHANSSKTRRSTAKPTPRSKTPAKASAPSSKPSVYPRPAPLRPRI